ncbi:MAG: hypothetical protein AB2693_19410 [Candidatus Thiodiazotropha sp.]
MKQVRPQNTQSPTAQNTDTQTDRIDLTESPKNRRLIKESTLLMGSSILKKVRTNELNSDTTVRSFSGATTVSLKDKVQNYDIDNCKTVVLHVLSEAMTPTTVMI